jgi:hypothetical protein
MKIFVMEAAYVDSLTEAKLHRVVATGLSSIGSACAMYEAASTLLPWRHLPHRRTCLAHGGRASIGLKRLFQRQKCEIGDRRLILPSADNSVTS